MKLVGHPFVNSESCSGRSFVADEQTLDMAEININGRYPETGWAKNERVGEMVYVLRGMGQLAIRDAEPIELKVGDVVSVSVGQEFSWTGNNLTILMACSPAFSSEQYTVTEENHEI